MSYGSGDVGETMRIINRKSSNKFLDGIKLFNGSVAVFLLQN